MLYFLNLYRETISVDDFTLKDLELAFKQWQKMDRDVPAMNDVRHAAKVDQAWRQYCKIRDLLTLDEEESYFPRRHKRGR